MGNFRRDNRSSDRGRSQMHKATCSECGKSCEVPFKPTGSKPIFCSQCFEDQQGSQPRRRDDRRDDRRSGRNDRGDKQMFSATCSDCGNKCEVPFRPTGSKPVYCSNCFSSSDNNKSGGQSSKQLKVMNDKLDQILKALGVSLEIEKNSLAEFADKKPAKKASKKTVAKPEAKKEKKAATKKKPAAKKPAVAKKKPAAKKKAAPKKKAVAKKK